MTIEERKAQVRRFCDEYFNKHHYEVVKDFVSSDYRLHDPAMPEIRGGLEALKVIEERYMKAFSDVHLDIDDQVAEGDKVVTRWRMTGRHTGEFAGIAPTNKEIDVTGITISRFAGDRIAEEWEVWDTLGLMKELGVCEAPI